MTGGLIALDVATRVGFAFGQVGGEPEFGSRDFSDKAGTGAVVGKFRAWLNERCYTLKPDLCAFESPYVPVARTRFVKVGTDPRGASGPPPMNPLTLRRLLGMVATVEACCYELRIPCREATSSEIIKFFVGKARFDGGRAEKKLATIKMCAVYGWQVAGDDNAADALALFHYAEFITAPQIASRRKALAGTELPLHGTMADPQRNAPQSADHGALAKMSPDGEAPNGQDRGLFTEIRGQLQPRSG